MSKESRIQDLLAQLCSNDQNKIDEWLNTPQEFWGWISPMQLVKAGREDAVIRLLETYLYGEIGGL